MIRRLQETEIKPFVQLCFQVYEDHYGKMGVIDGLNKFLESEFEIDKLKRDIQDPNIDHFIISSALSDAGIIKIIRNKPLSGFANYKSVELVKLYLLERHKGKGLGSRVIDELIQHLKSQSFDHLYLCVEAANISAINFYKKMKFEVIDDAFSVAQRFRNAETSMLRMSLKL